MNFLSYETIETFLSNFSFIALFSSMIAYWVKTSGVFIKSSNYKNRLTESTEISMVFANSKINTELSNSNQKKLLPLKINVGRLSILTANLSLLFLLTLRWIESGHFPLSNLYESLMFLSWALTLFHLYLEKLTESTVTWLGAMTSPTAFFTNAFANFSLPTEMQHSSALVPALQSNWLMMHVTVMILSYAALIFGSLLSIGFLILTFSLSSENYDNVVKTQNSFSESSKKPHLKIQWAQNLDNLSYRILGIGFPLLTIGILSGAVWANEAWGSYWSWDPKETWALLTWFVFAIYLHTRITKNWQGKKPALIASFGFFVVWVCYLGVNLLGEGLHSYGWLQS